MLIDRFNTLIQSPYARLMRVDRPIGTLLLLWPTWWALLLANEGLPSLKLMIIFTFGVIFMRAAGCVINDYADRHIDSKVKRTQHRPLATGELTSGDALRLFAFLIACSFTLVILTNALTIMLSVAAFALAACYPFMKRYTHLPQVVLGAAFSMSIPMAFAASINEVPKIAWVLFLANLLWTVAYDTYYAMVDRDDDIKIGVKSTAVLFAENDLFYIAALQGLAMLCWILVAIEYSMGIMFYLAALLAGLMFVFQMSISLSRTRDACFFAFLNNNYVGLVLTVGIGWSII